MTTVEPGKPAAVELSFRNVAQCETKVYRIDLMKFSLLRRDLSGITNINLAGIRPLHEATIELGDGKDYRDRQHELTLPLKEEGPTWSSAAATTCTPAGWSWSLRWKSTCRKSRPPAASAPR